MEPGADPNPGWRNGAHYRALLGLDQAGLAWEWLRRTPGYRAFAASHGASQPGSNVREDPAALPWGLHFRGRPSLLSVRCTLAVAG